MNAQSQRRFLWRIGRKLYCLARKEVVDNNITTNGETYVQACVLNGAVVSENERLTVFDVGANLGKWSQYLLKQLPQDRVSATRVFLFEPIAETKDKLALNISEMGNRDVTTIHSLAISDIEGEAEMVILSETGGTNSLEFDQSMAKKAVRLANIKKTTLDAFCKVERVRHIHLLKLDTEGHDAHALAGASELLQSGSIDVAQFEYNHRWIYARSYLRDVFDLIDGLPYRLGRICPNRIELFESWHFELERFFESNYLIIHENALRWFDVHEGSFDFSNSYS